MIRGGGVLMHISSLPGPFGTGVMGQEAIDFAKQLASQGMKYWQVLPFSYPGMGNSPYQSFSAFAGNWLFIDPRRLLDRGLLSPAEVQQAEEAVPVKDPVIHDLRGFPPHPVGKENRSAPGTG